MKKEYWVPEEHIYESAGKCLAAHPDQAATLLCDYGSFAEIQRERDALIKAHDEQVQINKFFQALLKECEPLAEENKALKEENEVLKNRLAEFERQASLRG